MVDKIRLGVSECLLGHAVRYDGQHKLDHFLVDTLGQLVEYVPVCPEVECGLGVPRESMRLVGDPERPRLVTTKTKIDHTDRMLQWARRRVAELEKENLCGYIFKSKSPSSGMERVKVYTETGGVSGTTAGLFAREFMRAFPLLPVEDEGRLRDPELRENFIERIFALDRYRKGPVALKTAKSLMAYQSTHKLLIMSHDPKAVAELGRIAAQTRPATLARDMEAYEAVLLQALKKLATVRKQVNVLQHMQGYFKKVATEQERSEMAEVIEQYRQGLFPLIAPVVLMRHFSRKYDVAYLREQVYLDPHPLELRLRNHA